MRIAREQIFANLARRSGAVVVSSSHGNEQSYELDTIRNGVFTQAILDALTDAGAGADANNDGSVSARELIEHLARAVPSATEQLQHPTAERNNDDAGIALALVPHAKDAAAR